MTRWLPVPVLLASLALVVGAVSCKKESATATGAGTDGQTLNVFIWSEYLPQDVRDRFTAETGIKLQVDEYDSNEALYEKLKSGVADYDVVVPSDYMVQTLIAENLVQPLDRSKLSHFGNIDPHWLDPPYDPGNKHSVAYLWGLTGLGYNKSQVPGTVDSWAVLFDPKYAGQINMLDDARENFAIALKMMGKSLNETDPAVLRQAADMLKKQKAAVKSYDSSDFAGKLSSGDVWLSHGFTGQLAKAAHEDKDGRFLVIMPKEGGTVAVDNLCIPATSKRAEAAHKFINFVMEAKNAADIINGTGYAGANQAARKHVRAQIINDPAVYPPEAVLKRCEFIRDLGDATKLYDDLWTEVKGE